MEWVDREKHLLHNLMQWYPFYARHCKQMLNLQFQRVSSHITGRYGE